MAEAGDGGWSEACKSYGYPNCPPAPGTSIWFVLNVAAGALGLTIGIVWIIWPGRQNAK
jgi:hypothetical protein